MKQTKESQLNELVKDICKLTGKSNNKEDAIKLGHDRYITLENAPIYGGWRLINVGVNNGAHYGAFGGNGTEPRLKFGEMVIKLRGIIEGLRYIK